MGTALEKKTIEKKPTDTDFDRRGRRQQHRKRNRHDQKENFLLMRGGNESFLK